MAQDSDHDVSLLPRVLVGMTRGCARYPRTALALVVLSCVFAVAHTTLNLRYLTHRNDLISKNKDYYQRWLEFTREFGEDEDLVAVVEGGDRAEMIAAIDDVAAQVRAEPSLFDRVNDRVDLRPLANRALLFLPTDQLRSIQDHLKNMAMLLEPPVIGLIDPLAGWKRLTFFELMDKSALVNGPLNLDPTLAPDRDPLLNQLSVLCRNVREFLDDPDRYRSPWKSPVPHDAAAKEKLARPIYFFSDDGSLAFLTARAVKDPTAGAGFNFAQKSIDRMRIILADAQTRHPGLRIGLTGIPVLENDEMVSTQSDSARASIFALIGVALLYFAVYRGLRYPLMTVAALVVGTCWSLGWVTLTVGHLNILSSAFAVMLIGMGDYGVLWVTRFGQERAAGYDAFAANERTAAHVGPSIVTAALTTALAFFATMLADLQAVAELGWIAGSGVLLCALSCFTVMPALLILFGRPSRSVDVIPIELAREQSRVWLPSLMNRPRIVLVVSVLVTLAFGVLATRIRYDHNLLSLQSPDLDSVKWQHAILAASPRGNIYAVSITNTPEEALACKERFEQRASVSQVVEVASLVPRDQNQKLEYLADIQHRLRRLPPRGTVVLHETPDAEALVRAADRLLTVLVPWNQLRPSVFLADFIHDLRHLRDRLESDYAAEIVLRLRDFQIRIGRDLMEDLHQLRDASTPTPITLADLPTNLRERYIGYSGKWLLTVSSKENLWDYDNLARFADEVRTVDAEATGRPFSILEGLRAMRNGFLWAGVYALIAMAIVLLLDFGTAKHAVFAFVPLAMGMITALGCLALLDVPLNPANLIAFPLILGVGADNGVHVLHDFRNRPRDRRYQLGQATGRGIFVAALTTILGFGTLMIANHRGLASLGLALALGVAACMATALVFLPALLAVLGKVESSKIDSDRDKRRAV